MGTVGSMFRVLNFIEAVLKENSKNSYLENDTQVSSHTK